MKKILSVSELPLRTYDGGKSAGRAYAFLLALAALHTVPVALSIPADAMQIFFFLFIRKVDVLMAALTCYLAFTIGRAQKRWRWLDHDTLWSSLAAMKKERSLCLVVNDLSLGLPAQGTGGSSINNALEGLTRTEEFLRKRTIGDLKRCVWNTDPKVIFGLKVFFAGFLLLFLGGLMPEGTLSFATSFLGWLAYLIGWLKWFIAWYNLL